MFSKYVYIVLVSQSFYQIGVLGVLAAVCRVCVFRGDSVAMLWTAVGVVRGVYEKNNCSMSCEQPVIRLFQQLLKVREIRRTVAAALAYQSQHDYIEQTKQTYRPIRSSLWCTQGYRLRVTNTIIKIYLRKSYTD